MSAPSVANSCPTFLQYNQLSERFAALYHAVGHADTGDAPSFSPFTIVALGFGTGVNIIATWQLWQTIGSQHHASLFINEFGNKFSHSPMDDTANKAVTLHDIRRPRLHIICTEPSPLSHADLDASLLHCQQHDPTLTPLITQILTLYPTVVSGCHRLHLSETVTLDLWFGDTATNLANLDANLDGASGAGVDAWFLDEVMGSDKPLTPPPYCTPPIVAQIKRLSKPSTTGVSKAYDDTVKHVDLPLMAGVAHSHIAIVGAGVSGLMAAWSLARRGLQVTLFDKRAPLSGASGNPRALLAPKMAPATHVAEHLHSISFLYSQRLYRQLNDLVNNASEPDKLDKPDSLNQPAAIFEPTALLDLLLQANIDTVLDTAKVKHYPEDMAVVLNPHQAHAVMGLERQDLQQHVYLPQAGLVNPKALADTIATHPNITIVAATVKQISSQAPLNQSVELSISKADNNGVTIEQQRQFDAVVIAAAYHSQVLDHRIFDFRKIRGQLSWFVPSSQQLSALPKIPLKYNGYCALFTPQQGDDTVNPVTPLQPTFLLGASFVRNDTATDIRPSEHQVSLAKLLTAIPEMQNILAKPEAGNTGTGTDTGIDSDTDTTATKTRQPYIDTTGWQARASIRAQTPDYHPLVGQVDDQGLIWTISGMGSKGFAFAPLCAEVLADKMTGQFAPLPAALLARLDPKRQTLQTALGCRKV